jgi:hypothetical protein
MLKNGRQMTRQLIQRKDIKKPHNIPPSGEQLVKQPQPPAQASPSKALPHHAQWKR